MSQVNTLGQRYTSVAMPVFGTLVMPAPGQAGVYFSVFADTPQAHTEESLWYYLQEYKQEDPRVSALLAGAKVVRRAGTRMVLRAVPKHVVCDGLIGVGDSVGPGGHVGILPSMFLGVQAAHTAAQAIAAGDVSTTGLAAYDQLFHGAFLRGLETESKIITSLAGMTDDELNRICQTLSRINLAPFFFGEWKPIIIETLKWVLTGLPWILRDWKLLRRML